MTKKEKEGCPVDVGVVYEGERVRGPESHVELGGPKVELKAELCELKKDDEIRDGEVIVVGKDVLDFEEGAVSPLGILLEFSGKEAEKDLESVVERRIHDYVNYIHGVMHLNQRNNIWIRVSKEAKKAGLKFEHIGEAVMKIAKDEFKFIEKAQITFITDEKKIREHYDHAMSVYKMRDERVRGMKDEDVDEFYGCVLCQSFSPNHLCIISPERIALCGATTWIDARAAARVNPDGPVFAVPKGEVIDPIRGEFSNVNEVVEERSNSTNNRFFLYSMKEHPHTSCGCFEAIAFVIPEVDGVGIADRNFKEPAVNGLKFSTMAGQSGGGEQVEGFLGFGLQWMYSSKFLSADGGWNKIVWMPSHLKEKFADAIPKEVFDKIPTEKDVESVKDLERFLREKGHPAVKAGFEVTEELENKAIEYIQEKEGDIYPDEAAKHLGITEDQLMEVIESLRKKGMLE